MSSPSRSTVRSEEHTSELQSPCNLVCRLLLEKKKTIRLSISRVSGSKREAVTMPMNRCRKASFDWVTSRTTGAPTKTLSPAVFFFFNDAATTEIYTLSLHDALPIFPGDIHRKAAFPGHQLGEVERERSEEHTSELQSPCNLVCRLLLEKKNTYICRTTTKQPTTTCPSNIQRPTTN